MRSHYSGVRYWFNISKTCNFGLFIVQHAILDISSLDEEWFIWLCERRAAKIS